MIFVVAFWLMTMPASALAGREWAFKYNPENNLVWAVVAALIPPVGAFCALHFWLSDMGDNT